MAEAVLFVELVPTTTGIKRNVEKELDGTFNAAEKKGTSVFSKIGGLAKGVAIAAGAAAAAITGIAIKGGFERMLKIEDAQAKLQGLGNSVEDVDAIMGSALASVKGTAFGLDTAATVAASAVAAGIKPGEELEKYLRLTADAATIAGISMDEMGSIMNKVQTNGRAMTENLNQLSDRGIPILQWLADEYGVTAAEMSKMVSQGEVDAATFNKVLQDNIGGAALKSGDTTRGAFANMMAALSRVGVALLENVFPYFKDTFNGITGFLDNLTDKIGPFAETMNSGFEFVGRGFRAMFAAFRDGDGDVTSSGFAGVMEQIGNAARTLFDQMGPFLQTLGSALQPVLDGVGAAFGFLWSAIEPLLPQFVTMLTEVSPLMAVLSTLGPVIGNLAETFGGILAGAISAILPFIIEFGTLIGNLLSSVLPLLIPVLTLLGSLLGNVFATVLPIVAALLEPIMAIFQALVPVIMSILSALLPVVTVLIEALAPILTLVAEIIGAILVPIFNILAAVIQFLASIIIWLVDNIVVPYFTGILVPAIQMVADMFMGAFGGLGEFFAGIWTFIENSFIGFINFLIDSINGFLSGLNGMGGWLSDITGGTIGFEVGEIPRLAGGGLIKARSGGGLFNIGEGRYDEMVVPLSPDVLDQIGGNGGGSATVNVYPQPGMSEEMIGRAAAREGEKILRSA